MKDIIGLDVFRLNENIEDDNIEAFLNEHIDTRTERLEIEGEVYVIRSSIADLNKVNALLPEDMDAKQAIPIQLKIADMLQEAGLNVGINEDMAEHALSEEESNEESNEEETNKCES